MTEFDTIISEKPLPAKLQQIEETLKKREEVFPEKPPFSLQKAGWFLCEVVPVNEALKLGEWAGKNGIIAPIVDKRPDGRVVRYLYDLPRLLILVQLYFDCQERLAEKLDPAMALSVLREQLKGTKLEKFVGADPEIRIIESKWPKNSNKEKINKFWDPPEQSMKEAKIVENGKTEVTEEVVEAAEEETQAEEERRFSLSPPYPNSEIRQLGDLNFWQISLLRREAEKWSRDERLSRKNLLARLGRTSVNFRPEFADTIVYLTGLLKRRSLSYAQCTTADFMNTLGWCIEKISEFRKYGGVLTLAEIIKKIEAGIEEKQESV